jgi:hypothetical protein
MGKINVQHPAVELDGDKTARLIWAPTNLTTPMFPPECLSTPLDAPASVIPAKAGIHFWR